MGQLPNTLPRAKKQRARGNESTKYFRPGSITNNSKEFFLKTRTARNNHPNTARICPSEKKKKKKKKTTLTSAKQPTREYPNTSLSGGWTATKKQTKLYFWVRSLNTGGSSKTGTTHILTGVCCQTVRNQGPRHSDIGVLQRVRKRQNTANKNHKHGSKRPETPGIETPGGTIIICLRTGQKQTVSSQ